MRILLAATLLASPALAHAADHHRRPGHGVGKAVGVADLVGHRAVAARHAGQRGGQVHQGGVVEHGELCFAC